MAVDSPDTKPAKKKQKTRKSQLRVVFDTNALYVTPTGIGSASDLVRQEIASLIFDSKYPDLEILWYLPAVVRHERQYQMQAEALKLRPAVNKIERLLGHNLALTNDVLLDHVQKKINEKETELGLKEIALNHTLVDWNKLIHAAIYRLPPFQAGEKEKGFRDALVAESFLQLLSESPKTPNVCRLVLVTSDVLLTQAVEKRIAGSQNVNVFPSIEELKGLINTLVSNVGPEFIAQLRPKAGKVFFVSSDNKDTLFYKEKIREKLIEKFKAQLEQLPEGTSFRDNGSWRINQPNFLRKEGRRMFWTSRVEIDVDAGTIVKEEESKGNLSGISLSGMSLSGLPSSGLSYMVEPSMPHGLPTNFINATSSKLDFEWNPLNSPVYSISSKPLERRITLKGKDVYEIVWSVELTMAKVSKKLQSKTLHVSSLPASQSRPAPPRQGDWTEICRWL